MIPALRCGRCGGETAHAPVFPATCDCGGLWAPWSPTPELPPTALRRTPLWPDPGFAGLWWKREDLLPTGSFKDRGAEVLAQTAVAAGARRLVTDSSGSAALAMASQAAQVRRPLTVHTPGNLPAVKRDALSVLGAQLHAEGTRAEAAARARSEAREAYLTSHVYHPAFLEGTARSGAEVLAERPDASVWIVPVGNGSLLLGLALQLERAGRRDIRLVAVQAAAAPGLRAGNDRASSVAAGINIAAPPRRWEILAALERQGGRVIEVGETALVDAHRRLAARGLLAETATAVALAAAEILRGQADRGDWVAWCTGSGLRA